MTIAKKEKKSKLSINLLFPIDVIKIENVLKPIQLFFYSLSI